MMIGPEPRTRIFEMSVRFGIYAVLLLNAGSTASAARFCGCAPFVSAPRLKACPFKTLAPALTRARRALRASPLPLLHHPGEFLEKIMRVMRPGRGFRVILDAEQRQVPVPQSFQSRVIQIHVREFDL